MQIHKKANLKREIEKCVLFFIKYSERDNLKNKLEKDVINCMFLQGKCTEVSVFSYTITFP